MSWDAYIDNMKASGTIEDAAIGTADSVWTKNKEYDIKVEDMKGLTASREVMYQKGVHLGGKKFHVLRYNFDDPTDPYLNLKSAKKNEGDKSCSATVFKTKTAFVIGVGNPDAQGGAVTMEVCKIGSYLVSLNY